MTTHETPADIMADIRARTGLDAWAERMTMKAVQADVAPGPCQLQASPFCEGMAVMVRLDPMAMAPEDPAPAVTIPTCQECFDHRSDQYLRTVA